MPATHGHDVGELVLVVEDDEIGVAADGEACLTRESQKVGDVGGHGRQDFFQRDAVLEQFLDRIEQIIRPADINGEQLALLAEVGERASSV